MVLKFDPPTNRTVPSSLKSSSSERGRIQATLARPPALATLGNALESESSKPSDGSVSALSVTNTDPSNERLSTGRQRILASSPYIRPRPILAVYGKPSALTERNGEIYKNSVGLDRRVVNKTLEEAECCRRLGIPITTFMLTTDPLLVEFVERFTQLNRGRAYYSELDRLGSFVLVDYMKNRRRRV